MSHHWLPAASGQLGTLTEPRPPGIADFADRHPPDEQTVTCELAPRSESVKAARDFTRITLQQWGMGDVTDVAELVVSELVTNALRHGLLSARRMPGEHPIGLRLLRQARYVMCLITDPSGDVPVRRDSGECAEGGRGLQVVESCSVRWGWQSLADEGKLVWALLQAELRARGPRDGGLARCAGHAPRSPGCPQAPVRRPGQPLTGPAADRASRRPGPAAPTGILVSSDLAVMTSASA